MVFGFLDNLCLFSQEYAHFEDPLCGIYKTIHIYYLKKSHDLKYTGMLLLCDT
jgi:hypothetical protein